MTTMMSELKAFVPACGLPISGAHFPLSVQKEKTLFFCPSLSEGPVL